MRSHYFVNLEEYCSSSSIQLDNTPEVVKLHEPPVREYYYNRGTFTSKCLVYHGTFDLKNALILGDITT